MFAEAGAPHQVPHFHAYYQDEVGIFSIDPVELIAGSLPRRQRRLVEAWAELHQEELRQAGACSRRAGGRTRLSPSVEGSSMSHPIFRVVSFAVAGPYTLQVSFDDGSSQVIDFRPVLCGELFGPLRDLALFNQVRLDPEVHTLVWPNGADFDPATLHDWPEQVHALTSLARRWDLGAA